MSRKPGAASTPGTPALAGAHGLNPWAEGPRPGAPPSREQEEGPAERLASRVCLGVVTGPHREKGAVRIKSFTEVPQDIARYGPLRDQSGRCSFEVQILGIAKGVVIARLSGVEDRDRAEGLRGVPLYLPRSALPQTEANEYYHADLIGLEAVLGDGTPVGRVRAVHDFGSGDTLELERPEAPPIMVPFTRAVVPIVELAAGRLVLDPPPGLLDETET